MRLVTSYPGPDLDGTASAIGHAEYLVKQGDEAVAGLFGTPHREARYVLAELGVEPPRIETVGPDVAGVVLVDASDRYGCPDAVDLDDVVMVIDHREISGTGTFPNARVQNEPIGACATLIAEKFHAADTPVSDTIAALLYAAIVSNTLNFQAGVTTDRDRTVADRLRSTADIPEGLVQGMFDAKSRFDRPLKAVIEDDFKEVTLVDQRIGCGQLEIRDAARFVADNVEELETVLHDIREERDVDHVFLTCADLEDGYNMLMAVDDATRRLLADALGVRFDGSTARRETVLLRKEMTPRVRDALR